MLTALSVQAQKTSVPISASTTAPDTMVSAEYRPHSAEMIENRLVREGFENVAVAAEDGRWVVTYENRIYRYEIRALEEVMRQVLSQVPGHQSVTFIPQNRGIPLVAVTVATHTEGAQDRAFVAASDISLDVDAYALGSLQKANRSFRKVDLIIHPQFKARFGNLEDAIESQINLAPEITTSLWKGMRLSAQVIIPLQNELSPEGDYVRPGLVTLNQTLRLPESVFVSATAGQFTQNRYGIDAAVKKYFAHGRWAVRANAGYTGYASYRKGDGAHGPLDVLTAFLSVEYYVPRYDLVVGTTYGQFLYEDQGWRVDVLRRFGEVEIGFFALRTALGSNGGFNLTIPLFPHKYTRMGAVRIRTAEAFPLEYRYRGLPRGGIQYDTDNRIHPFLKRLHPVYVSNQLAGFQR